MSEKLNPSTIPAGDARREAQKAAQDQLDQAAEQAGDGSFAIDPAKLDHLKVENEIVQHLNDSGEFEVPGALPEYYDVVEVRNALGQTVGTKIDYVGYAWIAKRHQDQSEIKSRVRRYLGPNVQGYVRVDSSMPEWKAADKEGMVDAEGSVFVGDCILYRCPKQIVYKLRKIMEDQAVAPLINPEDNIIARAQRHGPRNVRARTLTPPPMADASMVNQLAMQDIANRARTGAPIGPMTPGAEIQARRLGRR